MNREFKLKKEAQRVIDEDLIGWENPVIVEILAEVNTKRKIRYLIRLQGDENYATYLQA